jgi:chemotaxis protein methyltransferase CheR
MTALDSGDWLSVLAELERIEGVEYRRHRLPVLLPRLRAHQLKEGHPVGTLREQLLCDSAARARLLWALAERNEHLFEPVALWRFLRAEVTPRLRTYPSLSVWCVGCGGGQRAYAAAIWLLEEGLGARARVYATDSSETVLDRARAGEFDLLAVRAAEARYAAGGGRATLAQYFAEREGRALILPEVRDHVLFAQHQLVSDSSFKEFHLILYGGTLGEMGPGLRARALRVFADSLVPLGLLAGDPSESLGDDTRFEWVAGTEGVYRKTWGPA